MEQENSTLVVKTISTSQDYEEMIEHLEEKEWYK